METFLLVARFALFSAAMLLLGSSFFRLGIVAGADGSVLLDRAFGRWHRVVVMLGSVIALLSSLAWLDIEAGLMGGAWSDTLDWQILCTVLFQTLFGHVWIWALVSAAGLLLLALTPSDSSTMPIAVAGLSSILLVSTTWTGHAVMHRGIAGAVHLTAQIIHVLAASVWLGSLPALGFVLRKAKRQGQVEWRHAVRSILPCYSRIGYAAVGLVLLTGCVNSWFMVESVEALFDTTYGRILTAKIILFFLMVGVAIVNRLVLTPEIMRSLDGDVSFRRLWHTVIIEQGLGLSIIAAVSLLGTAAPAMSGHMEM